mmetsp:Transcript_37851/g.120364  ORF Transcript_37851/g.120364 Transcript_37851/m.120364 type:complete len:226 (-) Transcript_37851:390-1067(-)
MSSWASTAPSTMETDAFSDTSGSLVFASNLEAAGRLKGAMTVTILTQREGAPAGPRRNSRVAYGFRRCCARTSRASSWYASSHTQLAGVRAPGTLSAPPASASSTAPAASSTTASGRAFLAAEMILSQKEPSLRSSGGAGGAGGKRKGSTMTPASPKSFARNSARWIASGVGHGQSPLVRMKMRARVALFVRDCLYRSEACQKVAVMSNGSCSSMCPNSEKFLDA